MGYMFSRNNLITQSFQFIRPTTKHLRIIYNFFIHCSIAFNISKYFIVFHLAHPMIQKMLKSMKKWASYALWKWRGWFAKTKHNNLVCVFEFKFFLCCSIASNIPKNFVVLFLAYPMVQKMLKSMKNWASYALIKLTFQAQHQAMNTWCQKNKEEDWGRERFIL